MTPAEQVLRRWSKRAWETGDYGFAIACEQTLARGPAAARDFNLTVIDTWAKHATPKYKRRDTQ